MSNDEQATAFEDTPAGWQKRWTMELKAARDNLKDWHKTGKEIVERFLDKRKGDQKRQTRWNLFSANVITDRAVLYGQTPKVDVSRRFADADDDVARVAGELLERHLNTDIERTEDGYAAALEHVLDDRLLPGFGFARCRLVSETETTDEKPAMTKTLEDGTVRELAPAVPATTTERIQDVEVIYENWRDVLWSPARTWEEWRWAAWRNPMTREALEARFGEELAAKVPMNAKEKSFTDGQEDTSDAKTADPWQRAYVWEIWDKERKKVWWMVEGMTEVLDSKEDPLGVAGFWPFPKPFVANLTTSGFIPRPDYALAEDLYTEVNQVSSRITLIQQAIRVVGVHNKAFAELSRMLNETADNEMIGVDAWSLFAQNGGLDGVMQFMDLRPLVEAMDKLRDYRSELIGALYQITGKSDVTRGQSIDGPGVTATEQKIKAAGAGVRVQAIGDEFAAFASDLQRIRAELICKFFDPQLILERANASFMAKEDQPLMQQAVALLKGPRFSHYRIQVKPEAVARADFAAQKGEAAEVLGAITSYVQAAAPLIQQMPSTLPFLLEILQWFTTRVRGASTIEGVLDAAIQQAKQQAQQGAAQPQQPDPKMLAAQAKQQADQQKAMLDMQREAQKHQFDLQRIDAEVQAEQQKQAMQTRYNLMEDAGRAQIKRATSPGPVPPFSPGGEPT